jgi:CRP-like cAMP-binding protein
MTTAWTFEPTARGKPKGLRRRVEDRMAVLARTPLFAGLSKSHLRSVARVSTDMYFAAGQELVKEGRAGSVFFVIVDGAAKVVRHGRTVKRLGAGDFFGEMSVLTRSPRSASVISETSIECITLSASDLRSVLLAEPAISVRMLTAMAERLEDADRRMVV